MPDKDCKRDFYLLEARHYDPIQDFIDRHIKRTNRDLKRRFRRDMRIENIKFGASAKEPEDEQHS